MLTKEMAEPKFKIGDDIWVVIFPNSVNDFYYPQIAYAKIVAITWVDNDTYNYHVSLNEPWPNIIEQSDIFQTKEEVVEKYNSYFKPEYRIQI